MARSFASASSQYTSWSGNASTSLTVSAWFRLGSFCSIGSGRNSSSTLRYYDISLDTSGAYASWRSGANEQKSTYATSVSTGVWHNVVGFLEASANLQVWLNGNAASTANASGIAAGQGFFEIGRRHGNTANITYSDGDIAEVGVWQGALSAGEIASLAAGFSPLLVNQKNLINYWPLQEASSSADPLAFIANYPQTQSGSPGVTDHPRIIYPRRRTIILPATAASGTTLTQSSTFTNSNTFYSATATPGSVALTQSSTFTNSATFNQHSISQGGGTQDLTVSLFTNDNTFYSASVGASINLTASLYTNSESFYAANLAASIELTPSLVTNSESFYAATATPGAVDLTASLVTNSQTFNAHVLSQEGGAQTVVPELFTNSNTFYDSVLTPGGVVLTAEIVVNGSSFYQGTVSTSISLAASLATNSETFYSHTITEGTVTLVVPLVTNTNSFYSASVSGGETPTSSGGGGGGIRAIPRDHDYTFMVQMLDSGGSPVTGLSLVCTASKAGADFSSISPSVTERSNGWYAITIDAADLDTDGDFVLTITGTGAASQVLTSQVSLSAEDAIAAGITSARLLTLGQFLALK